MTPSAEPKSPPPELAGSGVSGPLHVAIIMDGNGRWAQARGLPRTEGHRRGVEALRRIVRAASDLGVKWLTVYSFSTENWRRPASEVSFLLGLFKRFVQNDLAELHGSNVRVRMIGDRAGTPADLLDLIEQAENLTKANTAMTLVIAFNYGARDELVRATRELVARAAAGQLDPTHVDEAMIGKTLDTDGIPDPELIIRSSGEMRLSNFLLWQAAYAEFVFSPVHWPEFDKAVLEACIFEYRQRDRRFGGLAQQAI